MQRVSMIESLEGRQLFAASVGEMPTAVRNDDRPAIRQPRLPQFAEVKADDTRVKPIAVYVGKLTTDENQTKRFMLQIVSDDGTNVVARIPGRVGLVEVTGTKSGNVYTLGASKEGRSLSVVATIADDGTVTGTFTHSFTNKDGETESQAGTIALKKVEAPTKPTNPTVPVKPVRPFFPPRELPTNIVVYTGTVSEGDKSSDVFVQTFTNKAGKTMLVIASKKRIGLRPIIIEATLTDTTITASKSVGDRSVNISLTIGSDGALAGTIDIARGEKTRSLTLSATKAEKLV